MAVTYISIYEFCRHEGVEPDFVRALYEHGLVELQPREEDLLLDADGLPGLERLVRLHHDLSVNIEGLDVLRHLLLRLEAAQDEIRSLRAQLRFYGSRELSG